MKKEILRMQNVTIKKGKRIVLEHANFSIYEGEFVYLINPIKSGRHVFTDFFGGRSAFEGQIYFEDVKISSFDRVCQEKKVYLLRQDTMLFTELSVAENLLLEKKKRPSFFVNKTIFRLKAEILLNELSAGKLSDKQAWELSRFEQHKVLLCGAIALKPSLIIIDSSFPEYTKVEQMEFVKILRTIQEKGIAILYLTPSVDDVFPDSNRAYVISDTRIIYYFYKPDNYMKYDICHMVQNTGQRGNISEKRKTGEEILWFNHASYGRIRDFTMCLCKSETVCVYDFDSRHMEDLRKLLWIRGGSGENGIYYRGKRYKGYHRNDKKICYLPAEFIDQCIFDNLNVLENILVKRNGSSFSITSKIDKVLAKDIEMFLGLSKEKLMEPMCAQNMYMRLKAVLFRYYLLSPDVIVLEQPYNYLDYTGRTILNEFLEQYSKKGISVIFWTANHMDLSETVATCYTFQDDVLIPMNAGTT